MIKQYKKIDIEAILYGIVAILGISFWFFLAFPFANHNESYHWISIFNNTNFYNILTKKMAAIATFRPLGQVVAYLGYKISGGSIYPTQIFNYILAILSWLFIYLNITEKKLFSIASLIIGLFFFSGYIYLFHLHGVFYSPLLLLIGLLFYIFHFKNKYNSKMAFITFIFTLFISLFHPFAFLIFISFFVGIMIEKLKYNLFKQHFIDFVIILLTFIIIIITKNHANRPITSQSIACIIPSYAMTELHGIISLFSYLLSIVTLVSINRLTKYHKVILTIFISIASLVFIKYNLPIIMIWIIICLLKTIFLKKWSISFLLIMSSLFPIFGGSGSPTYAIFVIMVCTITLSFNSSILNQKIQIINKKSIQFLILFCFTTILLLRIGINIPVVSPLAKPILSEKEKTFHLESIIDWFLNSRYREYKLLFNHITLNPVDSDSAIINRDHRPPTYQGYLDIYMKSMKGPVNKKDDQKNMLIITFGDENKSDMTLLKVIEGKFAGKTMVFL